MAFVTGLFWPRSKNDLNLEYLHNFINSLNCLYLSTNLLVIKLATKHSKKYIVD